MIYRIWCSRINIFSTCKLFCFKIPTCPGWCFICLEQFQVSYATQVDGNNTNIPQELLWASELQMAPNGGFSSSTHKINFNKMGKVLRIEESRERKYNKIWRQHWFKVFWSSQFHKLISSHLPKPYNFKSCCKPDKERHNNRTQYGNIVSRKLIPQNLRGTGRITWLVVQIPSCNLWEYGQVLSMESPYERANNWF